MMEDKIVDKDNVSIVERYKVIDVIKGYGICLMVCGHSGAPFTNWIYLFHMALFFIASGYLWNERNAVTKKNVVQYVKRKAKSLQNLHTLNCKHSETFQSLRHLVPAISERCVLPKHSRKRKDQCRSRAAAEIQSNEAVEG